MPVVLSMRDPRIECKGPLSKEDGLNWQSRRHVWSVGQGDNVGPSLVSFM